MKLLKSNGFILIETLIVTVFLMSIFTFLYVNIVPLNERYVRIKNYDDVTSVYAVDEIRTLIARDTNFSSLIAGIDNLNVVYKDITNCNLYNNRTFCETLKKALDIVDNPNNEDLKGRIIISKYELTQLKSKIKTDEIFTENGDSFFREYINYLPKYTDKNISEGYRIFIVRNVLEAGEYLQKFANIDLR